MNYSGIETAPQVKSSPKQGIPEQDDSLELIRHPIFPPIDGAVHDSETVGVDVFAIGLRIITGTLVAALLLVALIYYGVIHP
jgi:hypothetical protein